MGAAAAAAAAMSKEVRRPPSVALASIDPGRRFFPDRVALQSHNTQSIFDPINTNQQGGAISIN
jgi:hypothetical protein